MKRKAAKNTVTSTSVQPVQPPTLVVENVEELYEAVNDSGNAGRTIFLSKEGSPYVLSLQDAKLRDRPNKGLLVLQQDMSLCGVVGDPSAVVIDTTSKTLENSFTFSGSSDRMGTIRTGRGSHSIEWLTILGNPLSAAGIATDLQVSDGATAVTEIRVAHVISGDGNYGYITRGVDIRNFGVAIAGRTINAVIEHCEFYGGRQGIRLVNFPGPDDRKIYAVMRCNCSHHNQTGCLMGNNRPNRSRVEVRSENDQFVDNGAGCVITGAISTGNSNFTKFEAKRAVIIDNTGAADPVSKEAGGIVAAGANTGSPRVASNNEVVIHLRECKISGNQNKNFEAFGARCSASPPAGIAGTHNVVRISLENTSGFIVDEKDSEPLEQTVPITNEVIVTSVVSVP